MINKKRRKRYNVRIYTNMRNPFGAIASGFNSVFDMYETNSNREAKRVVKNLNRVYPYGWHYRIQRRHKGLGSPFSMFVGLALLVFCLVVANSVNSIFHFSTDINELVRIGFLILGIGGFIAGVVK